MATKKELQERTIEHLRGMCLKAGLDSTGDKSALIARLLSPEGRVIPPPPAPVITSPVTTPSEPTEPLPEPEE